VHGAGSGLGPLASGALVRRGRESLAVHLSAAIFFLAVAVLPLVGSAPLLIAVALVWGMGGGSNWVLSSSAIQRRAPDRFLGRLASADDLAMTIGQIGGALVGAAIAERTGSVSGAAWFGVAAGLAAWVLLMRPRADEEPRDSAVSSRA
jgi:predicted MFS family arabinose efflux permease